MQVDSRGHLSVVGYVLRYCVGAGDAPVAPLGQAAVMQRINGRGFPGKRRAREGAMLGHVYGAAVQRVAVV